MTRPHISCTPEMFQQFIDAMHQGITPTQLIESQEENRTVCSLHTFHAYVSADNARLDIYARAREKCADAMVDVTMVIADNDTNPQRAANRIKARQWWASKVKPKVYGDKLDLEVNGTVNVQAAILAGRRRAQLIDITPQSSLITTDIQSVDSADVDPFS